MAGTRIVVVEEGKSLTAFASMLSRVSEGVARRALAAALNHEARKGLTAVRRALADQTSIPRGTVVGGTTLKGASAAILEAVITGRGRELPLSLFGARQFSYGVRAKVWGRFQQYPHAFLIARYGGQAYVRTSRRRFPIRGMYGPSIPKEIVKDASEAAFERTATTVMDRAQHELARLLLR